MPITKNKIQQKDMGMGRGKIIILILMPVLIFLASLFVGRLFIDPVTLIKVLCSKIFFFIPMEKTWTDAMEIVVIRIRLPRAVMAMMVGAGLSISGAAFQGMFNNPLVSPYLLGVSSGAGFGAALAILIDSSATTIQTSSFIFGTLAVFLTYCISRVYKTTPLLMLVLSGIVVSSLFMSFISLIKFIADPEEKLPTIVFWIMGSFGGVRLEDILITSPPIIIGVCGLLFVRWRINLMSMGDREARAMGTKVELLKAIIIICTTMISAAAVSVCGIIGWVGLVIPHICRMWVGPNHKVLLPTTIVVGACYLLIIDNFARTMTSSEVPLGILTAIIGAPFFAYLLRRSRGGWF
jgi:iron complex transport system permease protein